MVTHKHCPKCDRTLPIEQFSKGVQKDGRSGYCKGCRAIIDRAWREKTKDRNRERPQDHQSMQKHCPRCDRTLPIMYFSKGGQKDGRAGHCKECRKVFDRAWRETNKDQKRAYNRNYRHTKPEVIRVASRKAYNKNPQYYAEWQRRYNATNPGIMCERAARRRARKRNAPGSHTEAEWEALKAHYGFRCLCCGKCEPEIKLARDHVIPLGPNGPDDITNIQPLCKACNSRKGTKTTDYRH